MKKNYFFLVLAICLPMVILSSCRKDKEDDETKINANGWSYVDLGLPSGTLWAPRNIGAVAPENYGSYIAWGDTYSSRNEYNWNKYKWGQGMYSMTKYCTDGDYGNVDGKTVLEASDDAASVSWKGDWRIPTPADWKELVDNCTWQWTTLNGVKGYTVSSKKNDNSIFLPASGIRYESDVDGVGTNGGYWSNTLYSYNCIQAWTLGFDNTRYGADFHDYRYMGLSIRPVISPN